LWTQLQVENAPFRILSEKGLISAPIECFDTLLLGHVTAEWQGMARIVGDALYDFYRTGIFQTGDLVLAARLAGLAEAGMLEWRGDPSDMARCEMRLLA
jgi:uncharacterized protein DUF3658